MSRLIHARRAFVAFVVVSVLGIIMAPLARADSVLQLIPGTAVLYTNTSGGGGNGGNTSSTSNATNIFAPASYVDYHQTGGEPTTVVDRYPFSTSFQCQVASGVSDTETACNNELAKCSSAQLASDSCYLDPVYVSNPLGLGEYSQFYTSYDGGQTFRVPPHNPYFYSQPSQTGGGGGDSHQAVGQITHSIFFVDLSGACVTMNISRDLGQTWLSNNLGCGSNPGVIDDRQWVATDETAPDGQDVYMNFNNDSGCLATPAPGCSIVFVKSTDDGGADLPTDFAASSCNAFTMSPSLSSAGDSEPTACPDPSDPNFYIAGPIVVDTSSSSQYRHNLYIPFEREYSSTSSLPSGLTCPTSTQSGAPIFVMYLAISTDEGNQWIRKPAVCVGQHDPANIFPQMTIDTAGNLYYTWSQTQTVNTNQPDAEGETDVYYTYSTDGGATWQTPIDLTKETGDSAVFPWMVAGSPGQVDLVMYKSNTGLNPNVAFTSPSGQPDDSCSAPSASCIPNTSVWNTYFGQSQNALNSGANFKVVQISDHPIHIGGVCTGGTSCGTGQYQNRDLLDFLTIDVDHTGAAYTTWADDNNANQETRQFFSRQLSGNSIFQGQTIAAMNSYPITDHAVSDPNNVVTDATGLPDPTCKAGSGMDVLGTSEKQTNGILTVTLTLDGPPTALNAATCSREGANGGLWGAEFWSSSAPSSAGAPGNGNFYIAYRDNEASGGPGVEAGQVTSVSPVLNHYEFSPQEAGTLGGTCLTSPGVVNPTAPAPCTIVLTAPLSGLGIKPGAGLYSISGFSVYYLGSESTVPGTNLGLGNTNLASIDTPFDDNGTGTTG
ncbi:MAG TPA: sialidase family protein [Chloroflexota bacterium]|nr:sialidase family protein [Chloroflexota bacterium]